MERVDAFARQARNGGKLEALFEHEPFHRRSGG
jgi:hypothetical protein